MPPVGENDRRGLHDHHRRQRERTKNKGHVAMT
jgi:hypothetical protein